MDINNKSKVKDQGLNTEYTESEKIVSELKLTIELVIQKWKRKKLIDASKKIKDEHPHEIGNYEIKLTEKECFDFNEKVPNFNVNVLGRVICQSDAVLKHTTYFLSKYGERKVYINDRFYITMLEMLRIVLSDMYYIHTDNLYKNFQEVLTIGNFDEQVKETLNNMRDYNNNVLQKIFSKG